MSRKLVGAKLNAWRVITLARFLKELKMKSVYIHKNATLSRMDDPNSKPNYRQTKCNKSVKDTETFGQWNKVTCPGCLWFRYHKKTATNK